MRPRSIAVAEGLVEAMGRVAVEGIHRSVDRCVRTLIPDGRTEPDDAGFYRQETLAGADNQLNATAADQIVIEPRPIVAAPTIPCKARLAQVSHRAETASGTAISADSAAMPSIDPMPNSRT